MAEEHTKCEHTCGAAGGCIICGENMLTVEIVQSLEEKLSELAPLSLSYKRVCEVLGIKKDVIGYVDKLQAQQDALMQQRDDLLEALKAEKLNLAEIQLCVEKGHDWKAEKWTKQAFGDIEDIEQAISKAKEQK